MCNFIFLEITLGLKEIIKMLSISECSGYSTNNNVFNFDGHFKVRGSLQFEKIAMKKLRCCTSAV